MVKDLHKIVDEKHYVAVIIVRDLYKSVEEKHAAVIMVRDLQKV